MREVIAEEGLPAHVTAGPVAELCKVTKKRATSAAPS